MLLLRVFGQIILVIVTVSTNDVPPDCIYFEGESGFVQLLPTPVVNQNSVLSMEVMAYNCESISLTIYNGKSYKLQVQNTGYFNREDGVVDRFEISASCTGLWQEVKLELKENQPSFYSSPLMSESQFRGYDMNALLDAFRGNPFYLKIHFYKMIYGGRRFDKPFKGFMRNIRFDDQVQSIDQRRLNGTLVAKACPKDLIFASNAGVAQLSENVTFNDNFRLHFELKIIDCPECCSISAILLSAISEDSYFIVEIVKNILYVKMKSKNEQDVVWLGPGNYPFCDGKWHQIAVLKEGHNNRIYTDTPAYTADYALILNFSAPLYIGQHPIFKLLSAVGIRNGFKGCLRSLHINGVMPEIIDSNLNEFVKLGSCSKKDNLFK